MAPASSGLAPICEGLLTTAYNAADPTPPASELILTAYPKRGVCHREKGEPELFCLEEKPREVCALAEVRNEEVENVEVEAPRGSSELQTLIYGTQRAHDDI